MVEEMYLYKNNFSKNQMQESKKQFFIFRLDFIMHRNFDPDFSSQWIQSIPGGALIVKMELITKKTPQGIEPGSPDLKAVLLLTELHCFTNKCTQWKVTI